MGERSLIVAELKRALRRRGLTYSDVARALHVSTATVKRLFSKGEFSLERVDTICELVGTSLAAVLEQAHEQAAPTAQLTLAQEREIVADNKLLFITWLVVVNRTPIEEIVRCYRFTEREVLKYFIRLDRLKVIELQPQNRARVLVSRQFSWRAGGPVQKYIHDRLLREFFANHFSNTEEEFVFHGGPISNETLTRLKRTLRAAARDCVELMQRDRTPFASSQGAAFVLALRPWTYSGFAEFNRG
jgi:AcrR family transcriptional regulator